MQQIGERLEWLGGRLAQLEELKNEFMRHVSHELKTPLSNIRESTALLRDETVGSLSHSQHEVVNILDKSGNRLTLLINNLLEYAAWKEQHLELSTSHFELDELLEEVVDEQQLTIGSRKLKVHLPEPQQIDIKADRDRMRTFLTNLLSNAIKYSPPEGVIDIQLVKNQHILEIDIQDQGPGIPLDEQSRVFAPFYQSQGTRLSNTEGTGIGLSLVQECIDAHGGSARFLPTKQGAHFHASLPIIEPTAT